MDIETQRRNPQAPQKVWVAGHSGMLGSALVRRLTREAVNVITVERQEVDLEDQSAVLGWLRATKPSEIYVAAAKVGGIVANRDLPAEFIYRNLMIATNIINAARETDVDKLVHVASSAIYPRNAPQPIVEDALMTGPIDSEHLPYAVAKIAGITMCQAYRRQYGCNFISAAPTNIYGPGDDFDLTSGHVVPAIIRKVHEAKLADAPQITVWGTGKPMREFLHVDDVADALVFLMKTYSDEEHVNVGCGEEISILDLTRMVCETVEYEGKIVQDISKPDGMARKLMNSAKLQSLGWAPKIGIREGIKQTYDWYRGTLQ
ncbi:GDP-L-fucose synthase family protein [Novosphingobium mangrovi (ex Huang et al. 2023)]|uniref:GDP-L-fucose synthase n=1 Tax=Novosphingobium mangrovi (ex Huang et al. 2023) TaxID=2976432 RepID=A0ABT2HZT4_9SPHN|nr:GDP-L-fucose synthase [Novosphingobium mangrovi (ex Huang et al. 2023)]MCT2398065.1 GDP-L-fucose synthase [Novosphingobium mangrovi (ex Huang et al. 2023)]